MIVCPHCKTEQMTGTMFCSECGWDLQTSGPKGREFDLGELFSTPLPGSPPVMPVPPNPVTRRNSTTPKKPSFTPEGKVTGPPQTDYPDLSAVMPSIFSPPAVPVTPAAPVRNAVSRWYPDISFMVLNTGRMIESPKHDEVTIGRSDKALDINPDIDLAQDKGAELGVSRRHALLTFQDEQVFLTDLGSTNRTFINRRPLMKGQPQKLHNGDEIRLGNIILKTIFKEESSLG
mgnify:CR=1 FL=1